MSCETFSHQAENFLKAHKEIVNVGLSAITRSPNNYYEEIDKVISKYNSIVGNSGLKIGERTLRPGKGESGVIVSHTERRFVSPPIGKNKAKLILDEKGGEAEITVNVCTYNLKGEFEKLVTWDINATKDAKDNTHGKRVIDIPDPKNKGITVSIQSNSLLKTWEYHIELEVED